MTETSTDTPIVDYDKAWRSAAWGRALKAFTVTMIVIDLFALGAATAQIAGAQPLCAHRSAAHAAKSHTTREGDSRWHVAHGELPTCNLDKPDDTDDNQSDDDHNHIPRRDHHGYHCTWHGCG